MIRKMIAKEFKRHFYLLHSGILIANEPQEFTNIVNNAASDEEINTSLQFLTELLHRYHQQKVIVLIDEYDTPIHTAHMHGYYRPMTHLVRSLLTAVLKDNDSLHRGFLTGILRTAKEGIVCGLNNISVFSLLSSHAAYKFGFTDEEVDFLLAEAHLENKKNDIKDWYNSYHCGPIALYNPWSLLNCVFEKGSLKPYWVNTSENILVANLIANADDEVKGELETFLAGGEVRQEIKEACVFPAPHNDSVLLWSLLLFTGYVTFSKHELIEGKDICLLKIPNKEIQLIYGDLIADIFAKSLAPFKKDAMIHAMLTGDTPKFTELLGEFVINTVSVHDITDTETEKSYHLFVLRMLISLGDRYQIESNRESGYGRYDIMLTPHTPSLPGIIIEFNKALSPKKESLEAAVNEALRQIEEKQYDQSLQAKDISHSLRYGIAIKGKAVFVKSNQA